MDADDWFYAVNKHVTDCIVCNDRDFCPDGLTVMNSGPGGILLTPEKKPQ
jgi:hypothetical protein